MPKLRGAVNSTLTRDSESYRDLKVTLLVEVDDTTQGPIDAINCPGLPLPGSAWLLSGDTDGWLFCRWDATVNRYQTPNEPGTLFTVDQLFSNKPPGAGRFGSGDKGGAGSPGVGSPKASSVCRDQQISDPLLEPQKLSGSFVKYQEEAAFDMYGLPVVNSAFERLRGKEVEFDASRLQVKIEQNVLNLQLPLLALLHNTVNASPLWGLNARCVKLSDISWDRKYYGSCYPYYTRSFTFDIRYDGFDKLVADEGTKVLNGHWDTTTGNYITDTVPGYTGFTNPDPFNPAHFIKFTDRKGNPMKGFLNGRGLPANITVGTANQNTFMCYGSNTVKGTPLTNKNVWFLITNTLPPSAWSNSTQYATGNAVTYNGYNYIAKTPSLNVAPPALFQDPAPQWELVSSVINNRGLWSKTTAYIPGDYVQGPSSMFGTGIGQVFIQKYFESDFSVLNVPTDF